MKAWLKTSGMSNSFPLCIMRTSEAISEIRTDLVRTTVGSENISPLIKEALIATEDENFYEHNGIVPKAILRALVTELTGFGSQSGGSTLTQQLVKQQILTNEVTFPQKPMRFYWRYGLKISLRKMKF